MSKVKVNGGKIKKSRGEIIFDIAVYAIAALFCVYCLYPFAIILGSSFETESNFAIHGFPIIPRDFSLKAYQMVFGVNLFYYAVLGGGQCTVQSVVFAVLLLSVTLSGYVFPVLARFENTTAGTFGMAAALAVRSPGWTAVFLTVQLLTVAVCWFFLYFPLLFITGVTGYFQAVIFNHIFDKLIAEGKIVEVDQIGRG